MCYLTLLQSVTLPAKLTNVMNGYQMTLLTKSEPDKEVIKDLIGKTGGKVTDEQSLGQRPLAYPIKKERQAYFTLLKFTMEPEGLLALNKKLLLSENLLRHMLTTAKARVPSAAAIKKAATKAEPVAGAEEGPIAGPAIEPAAKEGPLAGQAAKKTKGQIKAEKQAEESRQKKIEAELEKILGEE